MTISFLFLEARVRPDPRRLQSLFQKDGFGFGVASDIHYYHSGSRWKKNRCIEVQPIAADLSYRYVRITDLKGQSHPS